MKRLWIGIGFLAVLLALGIGASAWANHSCTPVVSALEQAKSAAESENWQSAAVFAAQARRRWEEHRELNASMEDHEPMDEISTRFAALETYLTARDAGEFTACCAELAARVASMGEAQQALWWNILSCAYRFQSAKPDSWNFSKYNPSVTAYAVPAPFAQGSLMSAVKTSFSTV